MLLSGEQSNPEGRSRGPAPGRAPLLVTAVLVLHGALVPLSASPAAAAEKEEALSAEEVSSIVEKAAGAIEQYYLYPEKGREYAAGLRERLEEGAYAGLTEAVLLRELVSRDLREMSHDAHLSLTPMPEDVGPGAAPSGIGSYYGYGFQSVSRLIGNVWYLDLRSFNDLRDEKARRAADSAMALLAGADAVIIDLRFNGGGTGPMADYVASHFFGEEPVHLLTNRSRFRGREMVMESRTMQDLGGERMPETDLYLLVGPFTASAAEHFVFGLKGQDRATLVGRTTAGAGQNVAFVPVGRGLAVTVSIGITVNPRTGKGWEGTGIAPDIDVEESEALAAAHRVALERLREKATDEGRRRELDWLLEAIRGIYRPASVNRTSLTDLVGTYGPFRIQMEEGALYFSHEGLKARNLMIPLSPDRFIIQGMEESRILQFERDSEGKAQELVSTYRSGTVTRTPREGSGA